jgi:hypothetical protein
VLYKFPAPERLIIHIMLLLDEFIFQLYKPESTFTLCLNALQKH